MRTPILAALAASLATLALHGLRAESWTAVEALFAERCAPCHSGEHAPLGLRLDSHSGVVQGSENGPVIAKEAPDESVLLRRLRGEAEPRMPLDGPPFLSVAEIALVRCWIAAGAPGSDATPERPSSTPPDPFADGMVTHDEVAAIFGRHCIECHSDNSRMGGPPEGVRLGSLGDILKGGDRLVVIPGNAQASEVIRRVEGLAAPRMPFDGPPWLSEDEVALLRAWIDGGARSADGAPAPVPVGGLVRIRGVVTGTNEIDGVTFVVTGNTRVEDALRPGDGAEMRGVVSADGALLALRLRRR